MPRQDAEFLLRNNGDFLLRLTDVKNDMSLVLTLKSDSKCHHLAVMSEKNRFFFDETHKEHDTASLINFYLNKQKPLVDGTRLVLKKGVTRPVWLLSHDSIVLSKKLGEGAFGEVYLAECEVESEKQLVAVKTMRSEATRDARLTFMKEARLQRKYSHDHVVRLVGIAVHDQPLMIAMEVCPNGALLSYLRKHKGKLSAAEKLRFGVESADGLAYLERQKCIHRDIAARNCLLSAKNVSSAVYSRQNYIQEVKISDFGLSTDQLAEVHDDTLGKVPVKWLAPEVMSDKLYSLKSDVWAFGTDPYPGMANIQARAQIIINDYRMQFPEINDDLNNIRLEDNIGRRKYSREEMLECYDSPLTRQRPISFKTTLQESPEIVRLAPVPFLSATAARIRLDTLSTNYFKLLNEPECRS